MDRRPHGGAIEIASPLPAAVRRLVPYLKGAVALGLLYLVFREIDLSGLRVASDATSWWTIPLAIVATWSVMCLQALRFWILLRAYDDTLGYPHTLKCHFIGSFYATFLPSALAIDVVRGVMMSRRVAASAVWGVTWIYKVVYLLAWVLFSVSGLIALGGSVGPYDLYPAVGLLAAALLAAIALSFSKRLSAPLRTPLSRLLGDRLTERLSATRQAVYDFRNHPGRLVLGSAVTLLIQLIHILGTTAILYGITGRVYLAECFLFLPLIDIVTVIVPLTPNGIGIREALYAMMFTYLQQTDEQLAIFAVLSAFAFVLRAAGAVPLLYDTMKQRDAASSGA